jgi:ABC-type transport system involved in multi-copper enzyme maturation permease subunit
MSTAAATFDSPRSLDRPRLPRLTAVELRKMTDTRSGFWLQLAVVAITVVLAVVVGLVGNAHDQTLRGMLNATVQPASVLLPVMGVLLVTSEWSQRTTLITFTLVPHRSRVVVAKFAASVLLSLAALAVAFVVAVGGTAIASPDVANVWSLPVGLLGQIVVVLVTGMMGGVAFGAVLLASAPAIVALFALPLVTGAVGSIHALEGVAKWTDATRSLAPMTDHVMSATEWARAGTTLALWLALPALIGLWRIARSEVS